MDEDDHDELINQFCGITNAEIDTARHYLEAHEWNVELAMVTYLDTTAVSSPARAPRVRTPPSPPSMFLPPPQDEEVMDMTPPEPAHPSFLQPRSQEEPSRSALPSLVPREEIFNTPLLPEIGIPRGEVLRAPMMHETSIRDENDPFVDMDADERNQMGEALGPPEDLLFRGGFERAKEKGAEERKWLLINIQDYKEFVSFVLNRDVWKNPHIRALVEDFFVFGQFSNRALEGRHFLQYYQCPTLPCVCILDPRTGELMGQWAPIGLDKVDDHAREFLQHFLQENTFEGRRRRPSSRPSSLSGPSGVSAPLVAGLSEDEQLARAIAASLENEGDSIPGQSADDELARAVELSEARAAMPAASEADQLRRAQDFEYLRALKEDQAREKAKQEEEAQKRREEEEKLREERERVNARNLSLSRLPPEPEAGDADAVAIQFRMPSGARESRRFRLKDTLRNLYDFISTLEDAPASFELVQTFPRKTFACEDQTLEGVQMSSQSLLHVAARN
eukprot:Rmarinus@m.20130